jgi:hypothetical protein
VLISLKAHDEALLERSFAQLKTFYDDTRWAWPRCAAGRGQQHAGRRSWRCPALPWLPTRPAHPHRLAPAPASTVCAHHALALALALTPQRRLHYCRRRTLLPASSQEYPMLGLNLLRLLVQNRIAEFHTELELISPEVRAAAAAAGCLGAAARRGC